jgi:hypothetical protein
MTTRGHTVALAAAICRLKAKGISRYRAGADHLLSLRTLKHNGTWVRCWQARRSRTSRIAVLAA